MVSTISTTLLPYWASHSPSPAEPISFLTTSSNSEPFSTTSWDCSGLPAYWPGQLVFLLSFRLSSNHPPYCWWSSNSIIASHHIYITAKPQILPWLPTVFMRKAQTPEQCRGPFITWLIPVMSLSLHFLTPILYCNPTYDPFIVLQIFRQFWAPMPSLLALSA